MDWACGKNHVRFYNYSGNKMRDVVDLLREGWYGSKHVDPGMEHMRKEPVKIANIWRRCLQYANEISVKICQGIEGTVGALKIDESYEAEDIKLPIDTLVVDLTNDSSEEDEWGGYGEDNGVIGFI